MPRSRLHLFSSLWLKCKSSVLSITSHIRTGRLYCISIYSSDCIIFDTLKNLLFLVKCKELKTSVVNKITAPANHTSVAALSFNIGVLKFWLFAAETMVIISRRQRAEGPAADITGWYQTEGKNCFTTYTACRPTTTLEHNISGCAELQLINLKSMAQLFYSCQGMGFGCQCSL